MRWRILCRSHERAVGPELLREERVQSGGGTLSLNLTGGIPRPPATASSSFDGAKPGYESGSFQVTTNLGGV